MFLFSVHRLSYRTHSWFMNISQYIHIFQWNEGRFIVTTRCYTHCWVIAFSNTYLANHLIFPCILTENELICLPLVLFVRRIELLKVCFYWLFFCCCFFQFSFYKWLLVYVWKWLFSPFLHWHSWEFHFRNPQKPSTQLLCSATLCYAWTCTLNFENCTYFTLTLSLFLAKVLRKQDENIHKTYVS